MGIDTPLLNRLADLAASDHRPSGRSLMLGRQKLTFSGKRQDLFDAPLRRAGLTTPISDLLPPDRYAEPVFKALGFGDIETLDFSDFEGAQILQDLNKPVPPALHGQFGFIFDGGTIEHVFNVPQALTNVFDLLAPGGIFASANGMNGWWGHGLYQFGADLVYSFWSRQAGCEVLRCEAVPKLHRHPGLALPDPAVTGNRLRRLGSRLPEGRVYLYYEVRKSPGATLGDATLQSDYAVRWKQAAEATDTDEGEEV
jgi:SAM-dependent methyltransferase